jgi:hypothetical protein
VCVLWGSESLASRHREDKERQGRARNLQRGGGGWGRGGGGAGGTCERNHVTFHARRREIIINGRYRHESGGGEGGEGGGSYISEI